MKNINRFTAIHSIYRFFLITVSLLIIIEIIDTAVLGLFPQISPLNGILLDVVLNSVVISTILYFLIFRPWTVHLAERKQAEKALRVSEIKYRGIIDQSHEGFVLTDEQGNILIWNAEMASITGIQHREAFGMPIWEIQSQLIPDHKVTEELLEQLRNGIKNILESQMEWKGELREQKIKCADGTNKIILDSSFLVNTNSVVYFGSIIQDITNRKNGEEELRSSEKKYRFMFENNPQPMFIFDLETFAFLEVNQASINHYGYSKDEFLSMTILDIHQAEDIQDLVKEIERDHKGIIPSSMWRQIRKNREIVSVEVTAHSIIFNGRIARHILINDITQRMHAEKMLKSSQVNLEALIENTADSIWSTDKQYRLILGNSVFHDNIKKANGKEIMQGDSVLSDDWPADVIAEWKKIYDSVISGKQQVVEMQRTRFIPEKRYMEYRFAPIVDLSNAITGVTAFGRDITKHILAEEALRKSQEQYRLLVENQNDLVVKVDNNNIFLYVSPSYCKVFGKTEAELIGKSFFPLIHEDDVEVTRHEMKKLYHAPFTCIIEQRAMTNTGWRWFSWCDTSELNKNNEVISIIGVGRDITEHKNAEEALRNTQKIKSIGLLSSGIAHDYNNLLNIMIGNILLATKKISADHQAVKFLERSLSAMKSAATLTKQILAYSGKGRFLVQTIDMVAMVQDHLTLAKASIPKNVSLQTNLSPTQVYVKGDPAQIEQIVMNLIINSGEAIGENQGVVSIEVSTVSFTNDELTAFGVLTNTTLEQQEYASLRVSDNGNGMNKETMEKIFDPFFTTKFVGRGLGLSAVLGIIRGHKGGITIESKEGAGTAVCVLLPIVRVPVNTIEPLSEKQNPIQASGKTVLLIDDEREIIEMLNNVLESGNYNRQSTIDPVIGVALYKEHWRNIDVVILDYSMPKMNGKEVLIELQKINSNVKVIISTGYSEEEISDLMGNFKPTSIIQKPYTPNALLSLLSTVLAMK